MKINISITKELLKSGGYILINKNLARIIGRNAVILFSELIGQEEYFTKKERLTSDGFFYSTVDNIQEETTLSQYEQMQAIKKLKNHKLIEYKLKGLPAKRHFKISDEIDMILKNLMLKNLKTSFKKIRELDVEKFDINNTNCNNNNKKKYIKKKSKYHSFDKNVKRESNPDDLKNDKDKINKNPIKKRIHPRWRKCAQLLANSIQSIRHINSNGKISQWACQFQNISKIDKIPRERIKQVLDWYCEEIPNKDKYTPVAYSGSAFRKKFLRIEDAMKRNAEYPPERPTKIMEVIRKGDVWIETGTGKIYKKTKTGKLIVQKQKK